MITTEQFTSAIRACISAEEFAEQGHLLDVIEPEHRDAFIMVLAGGTPFRECFGKMEGFLEEIAKSRKAAGLID